MTRFSGECSACPLLLDVLPELHKLPYFLVELGLHLADLLELCPDPPQGLGPQLAPTGCQREAQAHGDRHPPAYRGGCLRRDPLDRRGNIRDLGHNPRHQGCAIIGAIGEAVVTCGHEVSHGTGITEPGEIPTGIGTVLFLGTRGPIG
jgi:hypothetical protein